MTYTFNNLTNAVIDGAVSTGDGSVTLVAGSLKGDGFVFDATIPQFATIKSPDSEPIQTYEIVKITGVNAGVISIERAQHGTTESAFVDQGLIYAGLDAHQITELFGGSPLNFNTDDAVNYGYLKPILLTAGQVGNIFKMNSAGNFDPSDLTFNIPNSTETVLYWDEGDFVYVSGGDETAGYDLSVFSGYKTSAGNRIGGRTEYLGGPSRPFTWLADDVTSKHQSVNSGTGSNPITLNISLLTPLANNSEFVKASAVLQMNNSAGADTQVTIAVGSGIDKIHFTDSATSIADSSGTSVTIAGGGAWFVLQVDIFQAASETKAAITLVGVHPDSSLVN